MTGRRAANNRTVFGKIAVGNHQAIKYNAALLFDTNSTTRSNTFRTQVEYEF
jgi:hypothetical protein